MADHLAKAEDFEKKAEKKLSSWGLFSSKYEDAGDLFDKSANSFKLAKSCNSIFLSLYIFLFPQSMNAKFTEFVVIIMIGEFYFRFSILDFKCGIIDVEI